MGGAKCGTGRNETQTSVGTTRGSPSSVGSSRKSEEANQWSNFRPGAAAVACEDISWRVREDLNDVSVRRTEFSHTSDKITI